MLFWNWRTETLSSTADLKLVHNSSYWPIIWYFSSPYNFTRKIQFYMTISSILGSLVKAIKYDFFWLWSFSNYSTQRNCFIHVTWSSDFEVLTNLLFYESNSIVAKNVIRNMPLCTSAGFFTNSTNNPTLLQNTLLAITVGASSFMSQAYLSPLPKTMCHMSLFDKVSV